MKLLADANIAQDVINELRQSGHDVFDLKRTELRFSSDPVVIAYAVAVKAVAEGGIIRVEDIPLKEKGSL